MSAPAASTCASVLSVVFFAYLVVIIRSLRFSRDDVPEWWVRALFSLGALVPVVAFANAQVLLLAVLNRNGARGSDAIEAWLAAGLEFGVVILCWVFIEVIVSTKTIVSSDSK